MADWTEYKNSAKERGALALELYVVVTTPSGAPEDMAAAKEDHLAYQAEMESQGKLVLAGPLSDDSGNEMSGSGMILYRAASMDEARTLAENDPMHARGARSFTLRKWLVNEGSLNISVGLSTGKAVLT